MKASLQRRLFVHYMLVVVLIVAGFAVGVSALIRQYFLTAKQQELINKGHEMSVLLDDFMTGKLEPAQLVELVDRIDGFLDARIWAVDASGRLIVMSTPSRRHVPERMMPGRGSQMNPGQGMGGGQGRRMGSGQGSGVSSTAAVRNLLQDIEPVFRGQTMTRTFFHPYYGEDMMIVAVPITNPAGTINGAVILNSPVQGVNQFLGRVYWAVALIGLAAVVLTLFIARRLARGIAQPLHEMEETAAAMAEGRYDRRVTITSQDEVGQLGVSLNILAQELGRFVERMEQMEKLRRDFVANVSHELRTPLTIIRGYSEALRDGTVTEPGQAEKVTRLIVTETERLERLIHDLLDLSRLQAEQYVMEIEPIPLDEVALSVLTLLQEKAAAKGVELANRIEKSLPPIPGNGDRLVQLLLILLDNALKYTPAGGRITLNLALSSDRTEPELVLEIRDTGAGIPPEDLPFIWERFYKVDKAHSREDQGTGLGLSIAREIIERHGAKVAVESAVGGGTGFVVRFPIVTAQG